MGPDHTIVRPFVAPLSDYAAGHRGIDIAAPPGTTATAPDDGVVYFVGVVVDRPVLSIRHDGGLVSSYDPLMSTLAVGAVVHRGDPLGTVLAGHCPASCLHFGVRLHGEYVSPLPYLGGIVRPVLLPTRPVLLPTHSVDSPSRGLRARMGGAVALLEPFGRNMSVVLRRREARVPQHLLHGAKVGAAIEEVGGGGMAEGVRSRTSGAR